jgi:hypothetical protein
MRQCALSLLGALALAFPAAARPTYPDYIPTAPVDGQCGTCHLDPMGGGERNAFGLDAEATITGDGPDWSKLFCADSDGDGRTNGQELGDPCGTWTPGASPLRSEPVSAPADADDVADVNDASACEGEPPPECAAPAGAAGCAQSAADSSALAFALLILLRAHRRGR